MISLKYGSIGPKVKVKAVEVLKSLPFENSEMLKCILFYLTLVMEWKVYPNLLNDRFLLIKTVLEKRQWATQCLENLFYLIESVVVIQQLQVEGPCAHV